MRVDSNYARILPKVLALLILFLISGKEGFCAPSIVNSGGVPKAAFAAPAGNSAPCDQPGWFPDGFGLKDHTVFWFDGLYYIAAIYLESDTLGGKWFAYAASPDLCHWNDLGGILKERPPGSWDQALIWAPYVHEEDGVYYMFYTGVTSAFAQSIMLATSTNPADPNSWERQGVVFQPTHAGSVWGGFDTWSDCRDPTVVKVGNLYFLYYTGLDNDGGIVGLATASSPLGPWADQGAIVTSQGSMPESPTLTFHNGLYYLLYNDVSGAGLGEAFRYGPRPAGWDRIYDGRLVSAGLGEVYRYGPTPAGPWSAVHPFGPGWAHEIWLGQDQASYTSFLTDYTVTIRPLNWDYFYDPPHPFIGEAVHRVFLPLLLRW